MKKSALFIFFLIPFFLISQQTNSVLSSGEWYKIAVEQTGVHQLTYENLSSYGLDVENLNPKKLALFGNPARMLPESMEESIFTDLQQMAIKVVGEEDGTFDPGDYILFFGQGPNAWEYNPDAGQYQHSTNLYTLQTHYFLCVSNEDGKRIQTVTTTGIEPTAYPMVYDLLINHEAELVNPGKTGKRWLGEELTLVDSLTFHFETDENTSFSDSNYLHVALASNCTEPNQIDVRINGALYKTIDMPYSNNNFNYYRPLEFDSVCSLGGKDTDITFVFNQPNDSARAWLDFFGLEMRMKKELIQSDQLSFRTKDNVGPNEVTGFSMQYDPVEDLVVWNVTDPMNPSEIELQLADDIATWQLETEDLIEFHTFNGYSFFLPSFAGQVENQNLHGTESVPLLIITYPEFVGQANELKAFHEQEDNMSASVFTTEQVYNEFSSGSQDPTAIRNFVRYLWDFANNEEKPEYLLLFGASSYDYLDRIRGNTNFVPTYETYNSSGAVSSFATDQYFGLRDVYGQETGKVAVGRIPATTADQAAKMVEKIESYYASSSLGSWKNEMMFIGDDGDNNLHLNQSEYLVELVKSSTPEFNLSQGHLDFFDLMQTDEGPRYPEVNTLIKDKVNEGVFYVNYNGHGGQEQLAQERILSKDDLGNWINQVQWPIWVTGSGSVSYFDDPEYESLGESVFLNEEAGAIAFIAATRLTFASANLMFNEAIIEKLTDSELQADLRLGDLIMHAFAGQNDSKWVLLGDPALQITFPEFAVKTTTVNGVLLEEFMDTIPPGEKINLQGEVVSKEDDNLQADFNGTVFLKIYAPPYVRTTNGNQGDAEENVVVQDSILTEGSAAVTNGEFEIEVMLPAKYYEEYGEIKLSWYAHNGETDANGYNNDLVFGGEPDGVGEINELLAGLRVYPTVFSNQLTIESKLQAASPSSCELYSTSGVMIFRKEINNMSVRETLDIPFLSEGMYILRVTNEKESKHFKLFKQ